MKYDLSASHVMTPSVKAFDPLSLVEAQNEINTAYESLDESVRELVEVQSLMDNVQSSLSLLAKYGDSAIPQLNLDKGLEELLQIPEKMITAQKAVEGLGEAAKNSIQKLGEWISKFIEWVKEIFVGNKSFIDKVAALAPQMKTIDVDAETEVITVKQARKISENLVELGKFLEKAVADIDAGTFDKSAPGLNVDEWVNPEDPKAADYKRESLLTPKKGTLKNGGWTPEIAEEICKSFAQFANSTSFDKYIAAGKKWRDEYYKSEEFKKEYSNAARITGHSELFTKLILKFQNYAFTKIYSMLYFKLTRTLGFAMIKISKLQKAQPAA